MKIQNIYYIIWSDIILRYRKHHNEKSDFKELVFFISAVNGINLWIILLWLKYFNILSLSPLEINVFPGQTLNNVLSFAIKFMLPFLIINYYFVFFNSKYKIIIEKFPLTKINYALIYTMGVLWFAFVSAVLYGYLNGYL